MHWILIMDLAASNKAVDLDVPGTCHILYIPPGATHYLQPVDRAVFQHFKSKLTDAANNTIADIMLGDERPFAESMDFSRAALKLQTLLWCVCARDVRADVRANTWAHLAFEPGELEKLAAEARDPHAKDELFVDASVADKEEPHEVEEAYAVEEEAAEEQQEEAGEGSLGEPTPEQGQAASSSAGAPSAAVLPKNWVVMELSLPVHEHTEISQKT